MSSEPSTSMLAVTDISPRAKRILFAVVTEFIANGDPVGSRTLARRYGLELSAATIRNVLSDLEEAGLLQQPHTSAGRVPTDRALRLFIDALSDFQSIASADRETMEARFAQIYATADDPLRETGKYLSELSGTAAVVASTRRPDRTLNQLRFIPTRPHELLAVVVFEDGTVENRWVHLEGKLTEAELTRIHNLLADVMVGRSLKEVRDLFERRLSDDRLAVDALRIQAFELASKAVSEADPAPQLVIEGQSRLLEMPEYEDVKRLKKLMHTLEERQDLLSLLDRTIDAGAVTVFVGSETGELGGGELSLVVAPYKDRGATAGTVGVLGPTRMDYAKVMSLVDATASAMSEAIGRKNTESED